MQRIYEAILLVQEAGDKVTNFCFIRIGVRITKYLYVKISDMGGEAGAVKKHDFAQLFLSPRLWIKVTKRSKLHILSDTSSEGQTRDL